MKQNKNEEAVHNLRHSAAHLLAHAVTDLFPETLLTIGPVTEDGFFYDFLPTDTFKEADLERIADRMRIIAQQDLLIEHTEISKEEARKIFKNNPFKLELIEQIPDATVGLSRQGSFYDLCKGGHVTSTGKIKHFVLLSISGSYWRADKKNQALQRIYGTAFETEQELAQFLQRRADAQEFDHRKLGKQLDLFSFHDEAPGAAFFHDKGTRVVRAMTDYLRTKLLSHNYQEVATPLILNTTLWKQSGHYAHYKQNMFLCTMEDTEYAVRPMNCPAAILIYQERPRSYRELPLRLAEFGLDHRYELSGVLHGLMRVRAFTMDDAHIFCTLEQMEAEIIQLIHLMFDVLRTYGFSVINVALSTRPESSMGSDESWNHALQALENGLKKTNITYTIKKGEGAFYGPKIEFRIEDSMGREWQCSTIQVDFCQPENFDLSYINSEGVKARPVMIHRAIYGSIERFLGILLEHYKGRLPFWLAPVQMKVLTITDAQLTYAHTVVTELKKNGFRVEIDSSSDQISAKIKSAQLQKIPWMLVIGKKEEEHKTITLRYADGKQDFGLSIEQIIQRGLAQLTPEKSA